MRCDTFQGYKWDENLVAAIKELPTGVRLELRGDSTRDKIHLSLDWKNTGVHQHKKVSKWLKPAAQYAKAVLHSAGWDISRSDIDFEAISLRGTIDASDALKKLTEFAKSVDRAGEQVRLDY